MEMEDFAANYYFVKNPEQFGRVFVFIDFGNVRPWSKELWPEENKFRISIEVDIEKLSHVCSWIKPVKKFFYYGHFKKPLDISKENIESKRYRDSIFRIDKAEKCRFLVKSKEIKIISHYDEHGKFLGKFPKCNFDVEITMTMMQKIEQYDTVMVFSGDSDFGGLLEHLKSKGKKVIIVCTRNTMSSELQKVADMFIPAENLAGFLKYQPKNNSPER